MALLFQYNSINHTERKMTFMTLIPLLVIYAGISSCLDYSSKFNGGELINAVKAEKEKDKEFEDQPTYAAIRQSCLAIIDK